MKLPATILCIILIIYLFKIDQKKSSGVSNAIWIPFIWFLFSTARPITFWLDYWFHIGAGGTSLEEGNPIERLYLMVLITAGIIILSRRRLNWQALFAKNAWICVFLVFAAISFSWSEYPFVSLKRWFKTLGTVIMALVILTEERPYEAIGVIIRRMAFIHLPLSILFIKYYGALGREYHGQGATIYTGVADYKNGLGAICMISGIYFLWHLLLNRWQGSGSTQQLRYPIYLILLPMVAWLLYKSHSATAFVCLLMAVFLIIVGRQPTFAQNPGKIFSFGAVCIVIYVILQSAFNINEDMLLMLGKRPDLTTRVPMWEELLSMAKNPVVGFGFESFWLGERVNIIREHWGIDRQAHNGYLDLYLSLGYIGLSITIAYILSGLKKIYTFLFVEYPVAILRLCILIMFVLFNWTENVFHQGSPLWLLLLVSIIDSPALVKRTASLPLH